MANLIRSAKSGSDWTINELLAFNIQVVPTNATVFFGNPELPHPSISPTILDNLQMPDANVLDDERDFFLHLSSVENGFEESAVDDFAALLLRLMKYNTGRHRMIRSRKEISFIMAGQRVDAKTDICVIEDGLFILLVQEDNRRGQAYLPDIEPQLVAEAIAAFHQNNGNRRLAGLPELTYKLMPGIVMIGTAVVFYLIPVTKTLETAITTASYPRDETVVFQFIPPVPDSAHYGDHGKGMRPLENRRIVLQCFEAFKKFVVSLAGGAVSWSSKLQPVVALSTAEAEYMSLTRDTQQALWMFSFLSEVGLEQKFPATIYGDNSAAIALTKNTKGHARAKHIDVRCHYIRERVAANELQVDQVPSSENLADILTKPLGRVAHENIIKLLNLV